MADRLDALTVRESNDKSYWTKIGVAWSNKSGPGYIVRLDAMPAPTEGQFVIHLREPLPKDGAPRRSRSGPSDDSGPARDWGDSELDDGRDIPF